MKKIKISVVGTGHLGSIHCKLLKNNALIDFCGIYDVDRERALALAKELNIIAYESLEELIKNTDAVIIASSTTTHYAVAEKCLEENIHCFIEKPVTSSLSEAKKLQEISNKNPKLIIQVGHIERFNPAIQALKNYKIEPLFIEAHRMSQFRPRSVDVSVIHDLMIHDIDLVLWLINSPIKSIDANGVNVITNTVDIANARINFSNGAVANLTSSRISAKPMRKMRFFQKFGYFSLDFAKPDLDVFRLDTTTNNNNIAMPATILGDIGEFPDGKHIIFEKPEMIVTNAMVEEQNAFIHSIMNKKEVCVSLKVAADALEVVERISQIIKI